MINLLKKMKEENGFTLLEMSIVLIIIAALLLLIIPNVSDVNDQTADTTGKAAVSTVESQMLLYNMENPENTLAGEALATELHDKELISDGQLKAYVENKKK